MERYEIREAINTMAFTTQKVLTLGCTTAAIYFAGTVANESAGLASVGAAIVYTLGTALVAARPDTDSFDGNRITQWASFALVFLMLTPAFVLAFAGLGVISGMAIITIAISMHVLAEDGFPYGGSSYFFQERKQLGKSICYGTRSVLAGGAALTVPVVGFILGVFAANDSGNPWLLVGSALTGAVLGFLALMALTTTTEDKADNYVARYTQLLVSGLVTAVLYIHTFGTLLHGAYLEAAVTLGVILLATNRLTKVNA